MPELAVSFSVPFVAGLQRARMTTQGRFPRQYDTPANKANKLTIQALYRSACVKQHGKRLFASAGVPVRISIHAFEPLPKGRPKSAQAEPFTIKPDIDNIAKLVLDALNGVAFADDRQVTEIVAVKHDRSRAIEAPETVITIYFPRSEHEA